MIDDLIIDLVIASSIHGFNVDALVHCRCIGSMTDQ